MKQAIIRNLTDDQATAVMVLFPEAQISQIEDNGDATASTTNPCPIDTPMPTEMLAEMEAAPGRLYCAQSFKHLAIKYDQAEGTVVRKLNEMCRQGLIEKVKLDSGVYYRFIKKA